MRVGYACLTVGVPETSLRTCTQKTATKERLMELIEDNLTALENMICYNLKMRIPLLRISSDIIPFGSSPVNQLLWPEIFAGELKGLGDLALRNGLRLSMHPGQYTVLNSPDAAVVERAVEDLQYHTKFLDAMGLGPEHKLILHIGGAYGDKAAAMKRFCENYRTLEPNIKARLVIENDDKIYNIGEVLTIGVAEGIPVVFDNLHHQINPGPEPADAGRWIKRCQPTWKPQDGPQKTHYSQQAEGKRAGSHSETIDAARFIEYCRSLEQPDLHIMLEVKDKNLSAVKCLYALREAELTEGKKKMADLEQEWSRYKYTVLEHNAAIYQSIRTLLKDKTAYPIRDFYSLVDSALAAEISRGSGVNALQHVWGYFKDQASETEKTSFLKALAGYESGQKSLNAVKSNLRRLAVKYQVRYLLDSYYFEL